MRWKLWIKKLRNVPAGSPKRAKQFENILDTFKHYKISQKLGHSRYTLIVTSVKLLPVPAYKNVCDA